MNKIQPADVYLVAFTSKRKSAYV